ncbi:MAG: hypothetical protein IPL12_00015 [Bacteroidetes bacterium]|nr:hypothetical protein [Bacteroidota bacterium]
MSSSGITNVSYGYNLNSQIDFVVSENDIADQNFIFGYPETFEFEVYENFAQYTIYKGSTPFRMIKTKPDNPQYVLYSERCTYYFG